MLFKDACDQWFHHEPNMFRFYCGVWPKRASKTSIASTLFEDGDLYIDMRAVGLATSWPRSFFFDLRPSSEEGALGLHVVMRLVFDLRPIRSLGLNLLPCRWTSGAMASGAGCMACTSGRRPVACLMHVLIDLHCFFIVSLLFSHASARASKTRTSLTSWSTTWGKEVCGTTT